MYDGQRQSSTILTAFCSDADFRSLQEIMPPHWTPLLRGTTLDEARRLLDREPIDVVVTGVGLTDDYGWRDVLEATRSGSGSRPLIVASRCADEFLWAEVLNLGGFDVLNQPFEKEEVLWVLGGALRERNREHRQRRRVDAVCRTTAATASRLPAQT